MGGKINHDFYCFGLDLDGALDGFGSEYGCKSAMNVPDPEE
jgi:hypothetical protein